jgi:hypothetical protein
VHKWEANKENYCVRRRNPQDNDWNIISEKHIETNYGGDSNENLKSAIKI